MSLSYNSEVSDKTNPIGLDVYYFMYGIWNDGRRIGYYMYIMLSYISLGRKGGSDKNHWLLKEQVIQFSFE